MKSDTDMMVQAVTADPLNPAAVAALVDMMQEQGATPERADAIARGVTVRARIDAFVAYAQKIIDHEFATRFQNLTPPKLVAEYLSPEWCKIVKKETDSGVGSAYAFIRLTDGFNKTMGAVAVGGIYKPASYKKPAKHARGSVFSPDFDNCAGPWGINYLR